MYSGKTTQSAALYQRARNVMPGGNTRTTVFMEPHPLYGASGRGCRVRDVDGVERIDCINNFTAMIHGYADPRINAAVIEQLSLGTAFGMPTASEIDLAELLCARLPSVEHIRFTNSGTEAVMMALKAARAFTGRPKVAKCEGAYHGSYDFAEISLDSSPANWGNAPKSIAYAKGTPQGVLDDVVVIPFNDIEQSLAILSPQAGELAAILVDPLPNRAGLIPAQPDYIAALRRFCDETGVLLIFDEVISFRLGFNGAQGLWGINPDLTTLGKIIGGGFPVGAVGGRSEVMAVFDPSKGRPALPHGGTFSANPVSMRAGLVAMELLDAAAYAHLDRLGEQARAGIAEAFAQSEVAGSVTGAGSLLRVHFTAQPVQGYRSAYATPEQARQMKQFTLGLINNGVLAAPYGLMALSTPMTSADIDSVVDAVRKSLATLAQGGI